MPGFLMLSSPLLRSSLPVVLRCPAKVCFYSFIVLSTQNPKNPSMGHGVWNAIPTLSQLSGFVSASVPSPESEWQHCSPLGCKEGGQVA